MDEPAPLPAPGALLAGQHRRSRYRHRDLSTGSVPKHVGRLAWPLWLESILNIIDEMVDLFWAGRLPGGHRAIAGVGVAQSFTRMGNLARQGLDQALRAMVARAVGAGDIHLANHIALQAFTLTIFYAIVIVAVGWFLTDLMLAAIGVSEEVKTLTSLYMKIQFMGAATNYFRNVSGVTLQASGDVITPLRAVTATRIIGIIFTPIFMFGWLGVPSMGLAGAAVVNVMAQAAGAGLNLFALFRGTSLLHLNFHGYRADFPIMWRLFRIGLPASLVSLERSMSQLILLRLVTPFGDIAVAAYALARRVEMFANFGSNGIGNATGVVVGQNLGARKPERAKQAVRWGLIFVAITKVLVGMPMLAVPALFIMIFTSQPEVVDLTSTWLRILVLGVFFLGLAQVFQQSFMTAGDTMAPLVVTMVTVWLVEIPIAWYLTQTSLGPLGIAVAAAFGMVGRLAFYVPYYFRGRWLRIKVI